MNRFRVLIVAVLQLLHALAIAPPRLASAQGPDAIAIPDTVGRFRQTHKSAIEGFPSDTGYAFSDGSATSVSVVVYPIQPDVKQDSDPKGWLKRESQKFVTGLPVGIRRGWYDNFDVAMNDAWPAKADTMIVPGHAVVVNTMQGGQKYIQFQFLYLVRGRFVKFRATVPDNGEGTFDTPLIAQQLAVMVARP